LWKKRRNVWQAASIVIKKIHGWATTPCDLRAIMWSVTSFCPKSARIDLPPSVRKTYFITRTILWAKTTWFIIEKKHASADDCCLLEGARDRRGRVYQP
jgi:hypothetical protein